MADFTSKQSENVPGSFFVDTTCIACDTCVGMAPDHFKLTSKQSHAFVYHQPISADQRIICEEAALACPVEAIGVCSS